MLTFDDGFRNWLTAAAPLLQRLGVRATFYVCPGLLGGRHWHLDGEEGRLLDESEARELLDAGMELGSHSLSHPDLRLLDGGELGRELEESKSAVERLTGRPCRTLAYPYGLYDERVVAAAARRRLRARVRLAARPLAPARGAAAPGASSPRRAASRPQARRTTGGRGADAVLCRHPDHEARGDPGRDAGEPGELRSATARR